MRKILLIILFSMLMQPVMAKNVKVESMSDFSTANPPKTWEVKVVEGFVTKNGYGRLVVMDIEYFQKTMNKLYEATALNKGISELEEGRLSDGKAVMEEMRLKYGI